MDQDSSEWSRLFLHSDNMMYNGIAGLVRQQKQKPLLEAIEATRAGLLSAKASIEEQKELKLVHWDSETRTLCVPQPGLLGTKISGSRTDYEVTIKLFYLSPSKTGDSKELDPQTKANTRHQDTLDALEALNLITGIDSADVFIGSIAGVVFDEDEDDEELSHGAQARCRAETESAVHLYKLLAGIDKFKTLGVAEFTLARLQMFLDGLKAQGISNPVRINQINLKDCCVMPRDLMEYAKARDIELWTSADPPSIIPQDDMLALLREFDLISSKTGMNDSSIVPRWVIKYNAVAKDRSIVENKGYISLVERK